jgi:hypothetical protein
VPVPLPGTVQLQGPTPAGTAQGPALPFVAPGATSLNTLPAQGAAAPLAGVAAAQGIVNVAPLAGAVQAHGAAALPASTAIQPTLPAQGAVAPLPGVAHAHGAAPTLNTSIALSGTTHQSTGNAQSAPPSQSSGNNPVAQAALGQSNSPTTSGAVDPGLAATPLPSNICHTMFSSSPAGLALNPQTAPQHARVQGSTGQGTVAVPSGASNIENPAQQGLTNATTQVNTAAGAQPGIGGTDDMSALGPRYPASMLPGRGVDPVVLITGRPGEYYISSSSQVLRATPGMPPTPLPLGAGMNLFSTPLAAFGPRGSQRFNSQSESARSSPGAGGLPPTPLPQGTRGLFSSPLSGSAPLVSGTAAHPATVAQASTAATADQTATTLQGATTPVQQAHEEEDSDDMYGVTPPRQGVNRPATSAHPRQPATSIPANEAPGEMDVALGGISSQPAPSPSAQQSSPAVERQAPPSSQVEPDEMEGVSTSQAPPNEHQTQSGQQSSLADEMDVESEAPAIVETTGASQQPRRSRPVRETRNPHPRYSLQAGGRGDPENPSSSGSDNDADRPEPVDGPKQGDEAEDDGSGAHDDSDDEDAPPRTRNRRSRKGGAKEGASTTTRQRVPAVSLVGPGRNATSIQSHFQTVKTRFDVKHNPALVHADRTRRLLQDVELLRIVAPHEHEGPGRLLQDYLQDPPLATAKNWTWRMPGPVIQAQAKYGWNIIFQYKPPVGTSVYINGQIPYTSIPEDNEEAAAGEGDIEIVALQATEILKRLPYTQYHRGFIDTVLRVVTRAALNRQPRMRLPFIERQYVVSIIRTINPSDGRIVEKHYNVNPDWFVSKNIEDLPEVDPSITWYSGKSKTALDPVTMPDGTIRTPTAISDNDARKLGPNIYKAEKWARFLTATITDRVLSGDGQRLMTQDLEEQHGLKNERRSGIYGGNQLFYSLVSAEKRLVWYGFGSRVARNLPKLSLKPSLASVRTLDGVLASIPLEVGKKYFISTGDPRVAALYLAEAADVINEQSTEPQCDYAGCCCTTLQAQTTTHYCSKCLHERYCHTLLFKGNARICRLCRERDNDNDSSDVVEAVMKRSLDRNHVAECRILGKDPDSSNERKRHSEMLEKLKKNLGDNNTWRDDYNGQHRELSGLSGVRVHRDPFIPSVDAAEPYGQSHDKTVRYHTMENVVLSTSGFNYAKQRQVLGFLIELGRFDPSRLHKPEEKEEFRQMCDQLYLVAVKIPFLKKVRLQGRGLSDLSADQTEWRSGRPCAGDDGPWRDLIKRSTLRPYNPDECLYDDKEIERMSGVIERIEESFDIKLQRADDDAPWIAPEGGEPCPKDWGWGPFSQMMWERERRMVTVCNRYWTCKFALPSHFVHLLTISTAEDTAEELAVEFVWQICTTDKAYREFLDLPRTVWIHHPLRVSVAHRVHGKGMKTGWTRRPTQLSDRHDADNNTLFETWTSNVSKMDMGEAECIALRDDFKSVQLCEPYLHLYDASIALQPRSTGVEIDGLTADDIAAQSVIMSVEVDAAAVQQGQDEEDVQEGETEGVQGDEEAGGDDE